MNPGKGGNCCKTNDSNELQKQANIVPRVDKLKENVVKNSCGCIRATSSEIRPTSTTSCKPRRNSIITQCSVTRNQTTGTVSAVHNKTKVVTRPPLADIKEKSANAKSCSTVKSCGGAVKKVADPKPVNNLTTTKRKAAPLAVSTVKRNPTKNSIGSIKTTTTQINSTRITSKLPITTTRSTSTGVLPSTQIKPKPPIQRTQSTSILNTKPTRNSLPSTAAAATKPRACCCSQKSSTVKLPSVEKSLIPIVEQEPLKIPSKQNLEITVNTSRGFDCGSPILNASFRTPSEEPTWLTFQTNTTDQSSQFPYKEEKDGVAFEDDDSGFGLDNAPSQIISDGIPSLRKKILKKQLSVSSGYKGIVNLDPYTNKVPPAILYTEYMLDLIQYILDKEESLKLKKDFMKQSNILPIYRTAMINWLVKLHQFANSDSNVFFLAIRLFDKLLANMEVPQGTLQLTGMIAFWIAHKYEDSSEYLTVRKLQEISRNRYTVKCILEYEKKILSILNYNILLEDPIIFVRYYIYVLKLEDSNNVSFCANYLLDCLATSWDVNTFPLSLQASGAVFLSLEILGKSEWDKIQFYPGYYSVDDMFIITERILERLLLIQNESYEFREIYQKYTSEKYNYISLKVCQGIKSLK